MAKPIGNKLLRALVAAVAVAGVLSLVVMLAVSPPTLPQLAAGLLLAAATVPLMYFPYRLRTQQTAELDELALCVGLFLLPSAVVVLAIPLGYLLSAALRRWQPIKVAFNGGVKMLSAAAALTVAQLLDFGAQPPALQLATGLLVAGVYFLLGALLVCFLARLRSGHGWRKTLASTLSLAFWPLFVGAWAGTLVGLAAGITLWVLPLSAVAAGAAIHGSYQSNRYLHEQRRLHRFHVVGQELSAAAHPEQVERIIAPVIRELVEVDGAKVRHEPPAGREYGARLPSQDMWLVVPQPALSALNDGDENTLAVLADMADSTLRRIELVAELEKQSLEDHLTGAGNRRRFERMLAELASPVGERFSLALFDVDLFKNINDRHGHAAGDRSLIELTGAVRSAFRAEDRLFRLGGDEFVLLLPGVSAEHTAERLRELQRRLAGLRVLHNGETLPKIAISAGVAEYPLAGAGGTAELLRAADRALYRAKERGGSDVVIADDVQEGSLLSA